MVPNKDSWPYTRSKKSCDYWIGVSSQVIQSAQISKMNPQYMSSVAMKINAKLGGMTVMLENNLIILSKKGIIF